MYVYVHCDEINDLLLLLLLLTHTPTRNKGQRTLGKENLFTHILFEQLTCATLHKAVFSASYMRHLYVIQPSLPKHATYR